MMAKNKKNHLQIMSNFKKSNKFQLSGEYTPEEIIMRKKKAEQIEAAQRAEERKKKFLADRERRKTDQFWKVQKSKGYTNLFGED